MQNTYSTPETEQGDRRDEHGIFYSIIFTFYNSVEQAGKKQKHPKNILAATDLKL